jgi:LysR family transcriptional regulator for bpeEF and oprC
MDQFSCMRVFARVVELGSFARASEALEIARASATTAVARLEKRLGVRLLHRTTRRLSLTEDGRLYYQACVSMLTDLAEAEDALSNARKSPRGRLRVSTPHSFIHMVFLPALPRFMARYPDLEVEIVMTDRAVNLVEEGIDCAVRAVDIPDDSPLVARRISSVGSPALRLPTSKSAARRRPWRILSATNACASSRLPPAEPPIGASKRTASARTLRRADASA